MKPPRHLPAKARAFWCKVYPQIAHRLAETDLPNFEIMCLDWHVIQSVNPLQDSKLGMLWGASKKSFLALSKQYGLTPDARRKVDPPKAKRLGDIIDSMTAIKGADEPTEKLPPAANGPDPEDD